MLDRAWNEKKYCNPQCGIMLGAVRRAKRKGLLDKILQIIENE